MGLGSKGRLGCLMGVRALSASENQTAGSADGLMTLPELDMYGQDLSAPGQERPGAVGVVLVLPRLGEEVR
jgi:hypothetical protein